VVVAAVVVLAQQTVEAVAHPLVVLVVQTLQVRQQAQTQQAVAVAAVTQMSAAQVVQESCTQDLRRANNERTILRTTRRQ
jgi:hypothetical protein